LLPGQEGGRQQVSLVHNDCGHFYNGWVDLAVEPETRCLWTSGIDRLRLPVRHGEGRFFTTPELLSKLEANGQVALRYIDRDGSRAAVFPDNPNGSMGAVAGICDPGGRVLGLMPHPEAYILPHQAPDWIGEQRRGELPAEGHGLAIFRNAVQALGG
ncbi:phosphoribosylformylglycinamidine synthase subunit PurQ, partial [bacterium]|nr:phosphoribosylformylglycinamidine synthase subunit PurQ [candidate division CSSED10-310 bacterium]